MFHVLPEVIRSERVVFIPNTELQSGGWLVLGSWATLCLFLFLIHQLVHLGTMPYKFFV